MESSSYKVVLTSDATRGSTRYLQHYGVKGMKWGVVHDEDEKRRAQIALDVPKSPTGPYKSKIERDRQTANWTGQTVQRTHRTPHGDIVVQTRPSYNHAQIREQAIEEGVREGVQEALEKNKAQSLGEVVDKITSDEYREDVNFLQDLVIDELEERNPVVGQAARAVDNFLDGIDSFISDFVKSANKIVGDIMAWGKSLFGG